ncbi:MAG: alpha/beta hydrolase, partial [Ketobacter sp.]
MTLIEKAKATSLQTLLNLPDFVKRRIAGNPIQVEGLQLDLDMQILVKLSNL